MGTSKSTQERLEEQMERLGIHEADLIEKFILGSGSGGQKINKTSSCVYLKHIPSGIEIKCQQERTQAMNRYWARRMLTEKLEARILGRESEEAQRIAKIRRQKRKRSRRAKDKMLDAKQRHGTLKKLRASPKDE